MTPTKVTLKLETITPEIAAKWLSSSKSNRPIRSEQVAALVTALKAGLFRTNGETIIFDEEDCLMNGHHRLMAIALSGVTVQMAVARGVAREAITTLDSGAIRTMGDHLSLNGESNATVRASYVRSAIRAVSGITFELKTMDAFKMWEKLFAPGMDEWLALGLRNKNPFRKASVAGPLIMMYRKDPAALKGVYESLATGASIPSGSAVLTLREYLMALDARSAHVAADTPDTTAAKIASLVHAHIENRPMKRTAASWDSLEWFRKAYARTELKTLLDDVRASKRTARSLSTAFVPGKTGIEELKQLLKIIT